MSAILNANRKSLPGPQLLHHLISTSTGDSIAIDFLLSNNRRITLTYHSFEIASLRLARQIHLLLRSRKKKQHVVPIIIPQCPELYTACRAVLQAGACFCPVQPDVPPERLKFILNDVCADVVVCLEGQIEQLTSISPTLSCLPVSLEVLLQASNGNRQDGMLEQASIHIQPRDLAYIMYTSGSTGLPKGVKVSHFSVTQSLLAHQDHIPNFRRFLQFASPTFDVSIFEIFFPFLRGATLVGRSREPMLADLPGTIAELNADAAELTPTVAGSLLRTRNAAPCLQLLLTIGEMLTKSVVEEFGGSEHRQSMLFAMYGPTEAAIHCTLAPRLLSTASVRSIGIPLSTVTTFILKVSVKPGLPEVAMIEEPGELAIAGQLADGYLNRPDQDDAAFITLPGYGIVYRTGDRAICHSNGQLEILGRISAGQVKLRGQRVELGEIEEVATRTEGVSMAVALILDDALILFYESPSHTSIAEVQCTCRAWLPPFMRPAETIILADGFPRLPSGKIDRNTLESDYRSREPKQTVPRGEDWKSDTERVLARVFEREFEVRLARHSDLWSHGLDSLRAIRVATRLRQSFPHLSITAILESHTISDLAGHLESHWQGFGADIEAHSEQMDDWSSIEAFVNGRFEHSKDSIEKILPCSPMQTAMLTESSTKSSLNFNSIQLRTSLEISRHDMWNAFCQLAEKNEILRSGFLFTDSQSTPFVQVVWRSLEIANLDLLRPLQLESVQCNGHEQLTLRIHHALYDGWSWELMLDDLNDLFSNEHIPLRPSFETVACFQRRNWRANSNQQLEHWDRLLDQHVASEFPGLTKARNLRESRTAVTQVLQLPLVQLSELASGLHVARQSFLQAAWTILLSAYIDSFDVCFGTIVSGRHMMVEGIDQIFGPCLSTLPFRIDLTSVRTIKDLLFYIQRQWLESLQHSDVSLHDIFNSENKTYLGRPFDTLFVWQEGEARPPARRRFVATEDITDVLDYTAVLELEPTTDGLQAKLTVECSKVSLDHAQLILQQIDAALLYIASNLDGDLDDIWQHRRDAIMSVSNSEYTSYSGDCDPANTIRYLSITNPDKPAIRFVHDFDPSSGAMKIRTMSYQTLYESSRRVSNHLIVRFGVQPDSLVGVIAHKSTALYVAILGVVMSGAAYLCIDPGTPLERAIQTIRLAGCAVVMTDGSVDAKKVYGGVQVVTIHSATNGRAIGPEPLSRPRPHHLAYAVFTSGTTGTPKGVLITRKNLASNISVLSKIYPSSPTDSLLQACSPAFDVSVFEIFWTWQMGMTLCSASNDILFRDIESFIDKIGVTHLSMTPSVAALVHPDNVPNVRMLITAGEPMSFKVFNSWADRGLYQGYGPSETTNICNVRSNVTATDLHNNVGPTLPNTSVFICAKNSSEKHLEQDQSHLSIRDFKILPRGAVGEVWIGGDQVGRGYSDPVLTAQSFLDHPHHGRLYRSGDVGRLLSDSSLMIFGRLDDQAKLRGQRIEMGDINSTLLRSGQVRDCVSLIDGENGAPRLLTFCALEGERDSKQIQHLIERLFWQLEDSLPSYMIPDCLFPVAEMPLTRQGKVDKQQLLDDYKSLAPEMKFSRRQQIAVDERKLDETELKIAKAIKDNLNQPLEDIGRNTSFFSLGLDSISCIRFGQSLRGQGFAPVDVSTILRHPSIKLLSPLLSKHQNGLPKEIASSRKALDAFFAPSWLQGIRSRFLMRGYCVKKMLPCTDLQLSMLSSSEHSHSSPYQNTLRFAVNGDLNQLKHSLTATIRRHDLLRAVFIRCPSSTMPYVQAVLDDKKPQWDDQKPGLFHSNVDDNVLIDPLCISLQETIGDRTELKVKIHHALYDAEAMSVLLKEVQLCYHEQSIPAAQSFDAYLEYMMAIDENITWEFWDQHLQGMTPCRVAEKLSSEYKATPKTHVRAETTCKTQVSVLESSAKHQHVTVLSVLQCALSRLMFAFFDTQDVCFGNVFSGRNLPINRIENVIGPCFNALPIRVQAKSNASNQQLAANLQDLNREMLPFQPSSLRKIQRLNSPDGGPLFDILLLMQQQHSDLDDDVWKLLEDAGDMSFPFIFEIDQDAKHNLVKATLHSEVVGLEVAEELLACFNEFLRHGVSYPQASVYDFSCINSKLPNRQVRARETWNGNAGNNAIPKASLDQTWSATEIKVRDVLVELSPLDKPEVSKQTSLFRLGLDSINAAQIAAHLRKLGYSIASSDIMETPTVKEIAARCVPIPSKSPQSDQQAEFAAFDWRCRTMLNQLPSLDSSKIDVIRPCTPTQAGIVAQYVESNGHLYYNTLRLRLADDIDLMKLRQCWAMAVERHQMLRTGFAECQEAESPFIMVTYDARTVDLPWKDSFVLDEERSGSELEALSIEQLMNPPWELKLRLSKSSSHLEISMLHALYDAQSLDMILADVAYKYLGHGLGDIASVGHTVFAIIAQSKSSDTKDFWMEEANKVQPTKFPDLNIWRHREFSAFVSTRIATISLQGLREGASGLSCSLQTICQAAWAKILGAYTGQSRVTFGTVFSGRNFVDARNDAAFPCISTLPCPIDVSGANENTLAQLSKLNVQLSRHPHTPLTSIKRWQMVEAEAFDTVFVLQSFDSQQPKQAPWTVVEDNASAEYAVSLEVLLDHVNDEVAFRATCSERALPAAAVGVMLDQYDQSINKILDTRAQHPDVLQYQSLSVLSPKQERLPSNVRLLHEMVEHAVDRMPSAPALEFVTKFERSRPVMSTWTYGDLDKDANRVAHLLLRQGVETGDMVAVCFDKCPQASFAILGILKAGCTYVAIDPGAPAERQKFILQDSGCKIVLTTTLKVQNFLKLDDLTVIDLEEDELLEKLPSTRPRKTASLDPQSTCYCLYTSGTTGTPKGCLISHDSVVQAMLSFERIFEGHWSSQSRWLQFASFHFDVSVLEQYWSWHVGISVVSAPRDLILEDLPGFIQKLKITHLDLTPSLARLLLPEDVPSLCDGVFIVGGEQVTEDILSTWGDTGCLYNFYGPSEVTIGCTVRPRVTSNTKPTNIGQQWDNVGTFVLEPGTETPVIRGGIGELCLSGVLVGKGYLNRPDLTSKSFVTLQKYAIRVYRTGDLVRLLHDDSFEFLGRQDDQVKLRGQRLEIGEINQVVRDGSSDVKGVATMVVPHPSQGRDQLVTFISMTKTKQSDDVFGLVATSEAKEIAARLRRHCLLKLPGYMVPSSFLMVSFMPLTVNNKIDNKALVALCKKSFEQQEAQTTEVNDGSKSAAFEKVAAILVEFFHLSEHDIKKDSSLFELGLDSISAIGVSRKLRSAGFVNADVATLMRNSVVQDLVSTLASRSTAHQKFDSAVEENKLRIAAFARKHQVTVIKTLCVVPERIESIAPCTPLQEGMISKVTSSDPADLVYFSHFQFHLKTVINSQKLKDAWLRVQSSTSILRTYFVATKDGFAQVVLKNAGKNAGIEERSKNGTVKENSFGEWVRSARKFGPVIPWRLSTCLSPTRTAGEKTMTMSLSIFHGLYDGISLDLLLGKVARIYESTSEAPSLRSNFYEILPYGPLRRVGDAEKFWRTRLPHNQKVELPNYPHDRGRKSPSHDPAIRRRPTTIVTKTLSLPALIDLCSGLHITCPALFQAAWLLCLQHRYSVNPCLGLVVSGRSMRHEESACGSDAESIIGPMFNTLPFAITLDGNAATGNLDDGTVRELDMQDLAQACHDFNIDILPYQHTPLRDIAKWIGHDPREPLFDSLFVFQKEQNSFEAEYNDLWSAVDGSGKEAMTTPEYALNLEVTQKREGRFMLMLVAKEEYADQHEGRQLLDDFCGLLERVAKGEKIVLPNEFFQSNNSTEFTAPRQHQHQRTPASSHTGAESDDTTATIRENDALSTRIREQIATLTNVTTSAIGLHRPTLFEMGLDSIDAVKLAARLRSIGLSVSVSRLMRDPTVAGIAEACRELNAGGERGGDLEARRGTDDEKQITGTPQGWTRGFSIEAQQSRYRALLSASAPQLHFDTIHIQRVLPTTPLQQGLLLGYERYYHVMVHKIGTHVDLRRLEKAWERVARKEAILRTRFVPMEHGKEDEAFLQIVLYPHSELGARVFESRESEGYALATMRTLRGEVEDLRRAAIEEGVVGPTIRLRFSGSNSEGKRFLIIGMPHAAYDAWSLKLLHQEVRRAYEMDQDDDDHQTSPNGMVLYENHLQAVLQSAASEESRVFWTDALQGVHCSVFHPHHTRKPNTDPQSPKTALLVQCRSNMALPTLEAFCREQGVTLQSLGLTIWSLTLSHFIKQKDVCFAVVLAGRTTEGSEDLIFPTFNTVIFRHQIQEDKVEDVLRRVHGRAVEMAEHQHFPLGEANKIAGGGKVCDSLFTFLKGPQDGAGHEKDLYRVVDIDENEETLNPPYAVNLEIEPRGAGLWWTVATQEGVMGKDGMEELLYTMERVTKFLVERAKEPILNVSQGMAQICGLPAVELRFAEQVRDAGDAAMQADSSDDGNWSDTESAIREVLAEAAKVDVVAITKRTGLFNLGLDSISAIRVAGLLMKKGLKVPVSQIIEAQNVGGIAGVAVRVSRNEMRPAGEEIRDDTARDMMKNYADILRNHDLGTNEVEAAHSASAGQKYMLGTWTKSRGKLFYPSFRFVVENVERERFLRAVVRLTERIPMLRTTFIKTNGLTLQIQLTPSAAGRTALPWTHFVQEEEEDKLLVTLKIHHALYDAVSLQLMVENLQRLCSDGPLSLGITTDVETFLSFTHDLDVESKVKQQEFWTSYLSLPDNCHVQSMMRERGSYEAQRSEKFDPHLFQISKLDDILKKNGISVQALFFAMCGRIYSRLLQAQTQKQGEGKGVEYVVMGIYLANRSLDIEGLPSLAAPTFNVVPLKVNVSEEVGLFQVAREVQRDIGKVSLAQNCGVSLAQILEWTGRRMDFVVNFLKSFVEDDIKNETRGKVRIWHAQGEIKARMAEMAKGLQDNSPFLEEANRKGEETVGVEKELEWCVPSIDVEAKMEDGWLAGGVFAPEDVVDSGGAEEMLEEMRRELQGLVMMVDHERIDG